MFPSSGDGRKSLLWSLWKRWCSYLTGNTPMGLHGLLQRWLYSFICRWSYLTANTYIWTSTVCYKDNFTFTFFTSTQGNTAPGVLKCSFRNWPRFIIRSACICVCVCVRERERKRVWEREMSWRDRSAYCDEFIFFSKHHVYGKSGFRNGALYVHSRMYIMCIYRLNSWTVLTKVQYLRANESIVSAWWMLLIF
jgi:hypothetical protein